MVLPSSGQLSMSQIRDEFGGSNPVSLSQYYRGGSRVRNFGSGSGFINGNIPTSGAIKISDFYNAVNLRGLNDPPGQVSSFTSTPLSAFVELSIYSNGNAYIIYHDLFDPAVTINLSPWYGGPNSGSDFEVRVSPTLGSFNSGNSVNTWLSMSTNRFWGIQTSGQQFENRTVTFNVQFRLASNTSLVTNSVQLRFDATTESSST
jgi:hypothetical protein